MVKCTGPGYPWTKRHGFWPPTPACDAYKRGSGWPTSFTGSQTKYCDPTSNTLTDTAGLHPVTTDPHVLSLLRQAEAYAVKTLKIFVDIRASVPLTASGKLSKPLHPLFLADPNNTPEMYYVARYIMLLIRQQRHQLTLSAWADSTWQNPKHIKRDQLALPLQNLLNRLESGQKLDYTLDPRCPTPDQWQGHRDEQKKAKEVVARRKTGEPQQEKETQKKGKGKETSNDNPPTHSASSPPSSRQQPSGLRLELPRQSPLAWDQSVLGVDAVPASGFPPPPPPHQVAPSAPHTFQNFATFSSDATSYGQTAVNHIPHAVQVPLTVSYTASGSNAPSHPSNPLHASLPPGLPYGPSAYNSPFYPHAPTAYGSHLKIGMSAATFLTVVGSLQLTSSLLFSSSC